MKVKKLKTGKTINNAEWLVFDSYDEMYDFIYKNLSGKFLKSQMLNKSWLDEICRYLSMNCIRDDGKITTRIFKYRKQLFVDISICDYEIVLLREIINGDYKTGQLVEIDYGDFTIYSYNIRDVKEVDYK